MAKKPTSKPSSSKAGRAANAKAAPSQDMPAAASVAALPASRGFVRVYRQGLGDCILVRLKREGQADFKLLIDCGVVLGTPEPTKPMKRVVGDIVKVTESAVDILAITHEHWDHLSGFIQAKDDFKPLKAGEVWVAWTEDEKDPLAKKLKSELGNAEKALAASAKALRGMGQGDAADLLHDLAATTFGMGAAGGASTKDAFDIAKKMAGAKPPRYCLPNDAPFEIPGLNARIYVLGPPHDEKLIRKINPTKSAPETYALALDGGGAMPVGLVAALGLQEKPDNGPLAHKSDSMPLNLGKLSWSDDGAPFHKRVSLPLDIGKTRDFFREHYYDQDDWRRIDGDWLGPAAELALALQSYTNNTSLVLAIELGDPGKGDVLLFAADAQVGNWESWQTLKWPGADPPVTGPGLLGRTIFYKVGHHGSHNATMKEHGLETMNALRAAVIPVDEAMAIKKRWGHMPLGAIVDELTKKVPEGYFLRTDKTPNKPGQGVIVSPDYVEVPF
jgi:hypothetical protein